MGERVLLLPAFSSAHSQTPTTSAARRVLACQHAIGRQASIGAPGGDHETVHARLQVARPSGWSATTDARWNGDRLRIVRSPSLTGPVSDDPPALADALPFVIFDFETLPLLIFDRGPFRSSSCRPAKHPAIPSRSYPSPVRASPRGDGPLTARCEPSGPATEVIPTSSRP